MRKTYNLAQRQEIKWRIAFYVFSFATIAGLLMFLFYNVGTPVKTKAAAGIGMHGAKSITSGTVKLNEYTYLTANAAVGATSITVNNKTLNSNSRFGANLAAGDLIMIIQMQGATMTTTNNSSYGNISNYNNAGKYEFAQVSSTSGSNTINLANGLKNAYTHTGKVQVVRVPRYTSLSLSAGATITADAWNGTTGGILAIEVTGTSTINGTIDVSNLGFRGGAVEYNTTSGTALYVSTSANDGAEKGEGIAGSQSDYATVGKYGRGAPANGGGGGNAHNCGGGGGANAGTGTWNGFGNPDVTGTNYTTAWNLESSNFASNTSPGGGRGGYGWSNSNQNPLTTGPGSSSWSGDNRPNYGGLGGRVLDYSTGRIFMGGGGGAGDANNTTGTGGGEGGGIVFLLSGGNITGSGSILANGEAAANTATTSYGDAAGGGGGGGTVIVFQKNASISGVTIQAKGGAGGNHQIPAIYSPETEAPGGGGGGGYVSLSSNGGVSIDVSGGANGTTNSNVFTTFLPNGATYGGPGVSNGTAPTNPYTVTNTLPVELLSFRATKSGSDVLLEWTVASEKNNDYYSLSKKNNQGILEPFCQVKAQAWKGGVLHYSAIDKNPIGDLQYYSLSQTDLDGTSENLASAYVRMATESKGLTLHAVGPNPFHDEINLSFSADAESEIQLNLYGINGALIESKTMLLSEGATGFAFTPQQQLIPGTYFLTCNKGNEKISVTRLIKN